MKLKKLLVTLLLCTTVDAIKVLSIQKEEPADDDVKETPAQSTAQATNKSLEATAVKSILESNPVFDSNMFKTLLVRPDVDHIFLSDVEKLLRGIQNDFPEVAKLASIGQTWEDRDIYLLTIDGHGIFAGNPAAETNTTAPEQKNSTSDMKSPEGVNVEKMPEIETSSLLQFDVEEEKAAAEATAKREAGMKKPSILMTGAHHSRELITIQQNLFQALKLLHGGVVNNDPYYKNLLQQNVYHIVPVVNADGLAMIEEDFGKTKKVLKKRKNQNPNAQESGGKNSTKCAPEDAGVDLNRNYGTDWGNGNRKDYGHGLEDECADPCGECYRGTSAFSEKETQSLRKFIEDNKDQIRFVINFHSNGNSWIYPYNGRLTNDIETRNPGMLQLFQEISKNAKFPDGNQHQGNSKDIIGDQIGGDMDDWILATFNIPSVTGELGNESQFIEEWTVQNSDTAFKILNDNNPWIEHTYHKIGSQLAMDPVKYEATSSKNKLIKIEASNQSASLLQIDDSAIPSNEHLIQIEINVQNAGLSDMDSQYQVEITNENVEIVSDHSPENSKLFQVGPLKKRTNYNLALVLKIKDDQYTTYAKELENKREGIEIKFKMNEFGNSPLSSMSKPTEVIGTGDETPSPFAGFAQQEKDKPKTELKDHHSLKFFAEL